MGGRFVGLRIIVVLGFLVLVGQLWRLQVVQGTRYEDKAVSNRVRFEPIKALRGVIYDREHRQLVQNVPSFSVSIVPAFLPTESVQREAVFALLSELTGIAVTEMRDQVERRGTQEPFTPVVLKTAVERDVAFRVQERHLELAGVQVQMEPVRRYGTDGSLAHILGYVGRITEEEYGQDNGQYYALDDQLGKAGLEYTYEEELRGERGRREVEYDALGQAQRTLRMEEPRPGNNLVLTVDTELQRVVAESLQWGIDHAVEPHGRVSAGAAVALDPRNGEVLAMVSLPGYDGNVFSGNVSASQYQRLLDDQDRPLIDRTIDGVYPPGSTFKLITGLAALQEGVVDEQTKIKDPGYLTVRSQYNPNIKWTFRCWNPYGHGDVDFRKAIEQSCDVYFYTVAGGNPDTNFQGLGIERLARYAHLFGIGEPTGIDLPGEAQGLMPDMQWKKKAKPDEAWFLGDTYNAGIGQGDILVTPLQLADMVATVANGGTLYRPHLVKQVVDEEGKVVRAVAPQAVRQVGIDDRFMRDVREAMRQVVDVGTARNLEVPGVLVAGKTGTAEFGPFLDDQGTRRTHAILVAFAPFDHPEIALAIVIEGGGEGSATAVPVAERILRYYFGVPSRESENESGQ